MDDNTVIVEDKDWRLITDYWMPSGGGYALEHKCAIEEKHQYYPYYRHWIFDDTVYVTYEETDYLKDSNKCGHCGERAPEQLVDFFKVVRALNSTKNG